MWGNQNPVFVYGLFVENDYEKTIVIDDDWLHELGVELFAFSVQKGHVSTCMYGIRVEMKSTENGLVVDDKDIDKKKETFDNFVKMNWEKRGLIWYDPRSEEDEDFVENNDVDYLIENRTSAGYWNALDNRHESELYNVVTLRK
jgi:hypothetical protein